MKASRRWRTSRKSCSSSCSSWLNLLKSWSLRQTRGGSEFTREALTIREARKVKAADVIDVLADLFILRGVPDHIRSDNGPEFVAQALRDWIATVGARTACIEPGSPCKNGYYDSFNGKLRDELLNGEIFYTLKEAKIVIEAWRRHYNTVRPHSSLGYRPPAPETCIPSRLTSQPRPATSGALPLVPKPALN